MNSHSAEDRKLDVATPSHLTIGRTEEELSAMQAKQSAKQLPRSSTI